ncbi:hypothetical protein BAC2_00721 [uncultured bacterium]|nr:hypothetical protein BAC2_00721 [uncultured bacterium]
MSADALRAFLRAGMFVALVSLALVLTTARGSAEFVVSVCSLVIGLTLIGLVILVTWLGKR